MFVQLFHQLTAHKDTHRSFPPILFVWDVSEAVFQLARDVCEYFNVDIHHIHRFISETENIKISEIRKFLSTSFLHPGDGVEIFILENIHTATLPAYNAMLKFLEEPGEGNIVFLIGKDILHIPDTILSRVQIIEQIDSIPQEDHNIYSSLISSYFSQKNPEIFSYFFRKKDIQKDEVLLFLDTLFFFIKENNIHISLLEHITTAKQNISHHNASAKYELDRLFIRLEMLRIS